MSEWTSESMKAVCESMKERHSDPSMDMGGFVLYAIRFEPDGDIALVHRELVDGEYEYMISWMYTNWRTAITEEMIEDWSNDGQSPWYGNQSEYDEDKKLQEDTRGHIYVTV